MCKLKKHFILTFEVLMTKKTFAHGLQQLHKESSSWVEVLLYASVSQILFNIVQYYAIILHVVRCQSHKKLFKI